jgi:hypothetical protein
VTHDSTVDLDDPVRGRAVAPQPRPPSVEGGSIIGLRRSERGHPDRVAIRRVLEQHAEITIFDLAKDKLSRALPHGVNASGVREGSLDPNGPWRYLLPPMTQAVAPVWTAEQKQHRRSTLAI